MKSPSQIDAEQNSTVKDFKFDWVKYIPIGSVFVTITGVFYLDRYYSQFNFDISPFLTFSDFITLPLHSMVMFVIPISILVLLLNLKFYVRSLKTELSIVGELIKIGVFALFVIWYTHYLARKDYNRILKHNIYGNTRILLKDSTIINSDTLKMYIGHTNNYVFFYHFVPREVQVIPMNEVKMMFINKN